MFDFVKSHGLGNDYLVVDASILGFELTPERVRQICDRHTGVGTDGILVVGEAAGADFGLRILNPDGSEAEKSGNGLRIAAKYLFDHGYTRRTEFAIQTRGGVVQAQLKLVDGRVDAVRVAMGRVTIDRDITSVTIAGETRAVIVLSVGNPHCVIIVDDLSSVALTTLGPLIERHAAFPNRTNVQFVQVLSRREVRALIWERGAGHTLASGSSACAIAAACRERKLVDDQVIVHMEGGSLIIDLDGDLNVVMTGPAEEICRGVLSDDLKRRCGVVSR